MIPKLGVAAAKILCCAASLLLTVGARADVRLPNLFSDNMVLQQQTKVPVWGWADEGEEVVFGGEGRFGNGAFHRNRDQVGSSKLVM